MYTHTQCHTHTHTNQPIHITHTHTHPESVLRSSSGSDADLSGRQTMSTHSSQIIKLRRARNKCGNSVGMPCKPLQSTWQLLHASPRMKWSTCLSQSLSLPACAESHQGRLLCCRPPSLPPGMLSTQERMSDCHRFVSKS